MIVNGDLIIGSTAKGSLVICHDKSSDEYVAYLCGIYNSKTLIVDKDRYAANEKRFINNIYDINSEINSYNHNHVENLDELREIYENSHINETIIILSNILSEESYIRIIEIAIRGIKGNNEEIKMICLDNLRCYLKDRKPEWYKGNLTQYRAKIRKEIGKYIDWEWEWDIS